MNLSSISARNQQAENDKERQRRAASEMRRRTIMQGRQYAGELVSREIDKIVPEGWRTAARFIFPMWYSRAWDWVLRAFLTVAVWLHRVIAFIPRTIPRYIAQSVFKSGCYARIVQGEGGEWIVGIKIFRGWKLKYRCDMDVRTGRIMEQWKDTDPKKVQ